MDAIIAYLTESDASLQQALQWILEDQPESVLAGSPDACLGAHSGALDARAYILQFSKSRLAQAQGAVGALGDSSVPASPSAVARHPAHQVSHLTECVLLNRDASRAVMSAQSRACGMLCCEACCAQ